jgi:5-methylcytosine-specific restriction endonuclease McrA
MTASAAQRKPLRTLVLNSNFRPLGTWPLSLIDARDAVSAIWRDRVTVVEPWPGEFFRSPSLTMPVPKTVALREFARVHGEPKFCRRSILLRDSYTCQYCSGQFDSQDLTYDHLQPRSRGGRTEWANIVSACLRCNAEQGDRPASAKRPLRAPRRPTNFELLEAGLRHLPNDVRETWRDFLYWNVELDPN